MQLSDCKVYWIWFKDLANMYHLLSLLDDSHLDVMISELELHMTQTGLTIIQSLESDGSKDSVSEKFLSQK